MPIYCRASATSALTDACTLSPSSGQSQNLKVSSAMFFSKYWKMPKSSCELLSNRDEKLNTCTWLLILAKQDPVSRTRLEVDVPIPSGIYRVT